MLLQIARQFMFIWLNTYMKDNTSSSDGITKPRIYTISYAGVYPLYIAKAEKKGRTKQEVDQIIMWLTGYNQADLDRLLVEQPNFETFIMSAPKLNPSRSQITGIICGIRVEEIEDKTTQEIRYLDKLIDELAKGKSMDKILRRA